MTERGSRLDRREGALARYYFFKTEGYRAVLYVIDFQMRQTFAYSPCSRTTKDEGFI